MQPHVTTLGFEAPSADTVVAPAVGQYGFVTALSTPIDLITEMSLPPAKAKHKAMAKAKVVDLDDFESIVEAALRG